MDQKYKQLDHELSALSKVFSELAARLSESAKEVAAPGVMPSEKLLDQISASRKQFEHVRSAVHGHAVAMLVSPLPKLGELVSIATIDALLKAAAIAEQTKSSIEDERAQALAILDRVLAITHRESADFKALQECHASVGALRNAVSNVLWPHRHPESESIVQSRHAATELLYFVENLNQLDDERWMALEAKITESYGKPLFVAASRGKLAVRADAKRPGQPAPAPEKPVEKKVTADKPPEKPAAPASAFEKKPAPPAPSTPAPAQTAAPAAAAEKKPAPQVVPAPAASAPPAPQAPVAPAAVTAVAPPAAVAATPASPRPPAPARVAQPAPVAATPLNQVPAEPAPAAVSSPAASPLSVTMNSLTALANATEPAEKKPAAAGIESGDKHRKEPRLATPSTQIARTEPTAQALPESDHQGIPGDASQRPQRWGFWRGNR